MFTHADPTPVTSPDPPLAPPHHEPASHNASPHNAPAPFQSRRESGVAFCACEEAQPLSCLPPGSNRVLAAAPVLVGMLYGVEEREIVATLGRPAVHPDEIAAEIALGLRCGSVSDPKLAVAGGAVPGRRGCRQKQRRRRGKKARGSAAGGVGGAAGDGREEEVSGECQGDAEADVDNVVLRYWWKHTRAPMELVRTMHSQVAAWEVRVDPTHARCQLAWMEAAFGLLCCAVAHGTLHYAPYEEGYPIPDPLPSRLRLARLAPRPDAPSTLQLSEAAEARLAARGRAAGRKGGGRRRERREAAAAGVLRDSCEWILDPSLNDSVLALALRTSDEFAESFLLLEDDQGDEVEEEDESEGENEDENDEVTSDEEKELHQWAIDRYAQVREELDRGGGCVGGDWSVLGDLGLLQSSLDALLNGRGSDSSPSPWPLTLHLLMHSPLESQLQWGASAQRLLALETAGCGVCAQTSEVLVVEVLQRLGVLASARGEMELQYGSGGAPKADFAFERVSGAGADVGVGVSVTRAFDAFDIATNGGPLHQAKRHFRFTAKRARRLLWRKTRTLWQAQEAAVAGSRWSQNMVAVWCSSERSAVVLQECWREMVAGEVEGMDAELIRSTSLLVLVPFFGNVHLGRSFLFGPW